MQIAVSYQNGFLICLKSYLWKQIIGPMQYMQYMYSYQNMYKLSKRFFNMLEKYLWKQIIGPMQYMQYMYSPI
jgi:hypothetical protein